MVAHDPLSHSLDVAPIVSVIAAQQRRIEELETLLERFSLHEIAWPSALSRNTAQTWIREGHELVLQVDRTLGKEVLPC